MRRRVEHMRSRKAIGSEKALTLVGLSASSGVGGTRRLVGALPVRGEHVYAERGGFLQYEVRDRKGTYFSQVLQQ